MSRRELSTIVARAKALRSAPRAKPSIQLPVRHPVDLPDVAAVVAARLESELNVGPLRVTEGPTEEPHGWEAHVYRFRIQRLANLPPPYDGPLGLRAYDTPHALTRAQHEFEVMRAVQASGYPAPRPLLLEEDCRLLGGPFLILPFLPPLTVRDGIGYGVDGAMDPLSYVIPFIWDRLAMRLGNTVNDRSLNLDLFQGFEETTVDMYSAVRNGYLQRRFNLIHPNQ